MLTMATPEGTVTSLEASSWHCPSFPFSSTGETLDPVNGSGGSGAAASFPSLEASSWLFMESSVHLLESLSAATYSVGFRGAMYTVDGTSWSSLPPVWFGPAVLSPALRRLWVDVFVGLGLPGVESAC
jgi:hypothetical protein